MTRVEFDKLHGLGNDFVIVDTRAHAVTLDQLRAAAVEVCDRRKGIGADGILALSAPTSTEAVATMTVFNADGSVAEMCGNGIRCVAKYLAERQNLGSALTIDTGAGPLLCRLDYGDELRVTVNMGKPSFDGAKVPTANGAELIAEPLSSLDLPFTAVSMSNPHAVTFVDHHSMSQLHRLADQLGPKVETHSHFPNKTNVEFASVVHSGEINLVVWERGCGITQACGTGACATYAAARRLGLVESRCRVNLPGGALLIADAEEDSVTMTGPATFVFSGVVEI